MLKTFNIALTGVLLMTAVSAVQAKITAEQAATLGGDTLTPIGAERAGNKEGTIPAWDGGLKEFPAGYKVGDRLVDPYSADQPLFTITAENYEQYSKNLSPGQVALIKRYPDTFKMRVYPTRLRARVPDSE